MATEHALGWLGPNTLIQAVQMLHYTCKPALVQKILLSRSPIHASLLQRRAVRFMESVVRSSEEEIQECCEDLPLHTLDLVGIAVLVLVCYALLAPKALSRGEAKIHRRK